MVQAGVYFRPDPLLSRRWKQMGGNPHDRRQGVWRKMKELPTDDPLFSEKGSIRVDGRKIHPAYLF